MAHGIQLAYWLCAVVALAMGVALLAGRHLPPKLARGASIVCVSVLCVKVVTTLVLLLRGAPGFDSDFAIFHAVGVDVLAGKNPYEAAAFAAHPILHPPSAFPVFALFALVPYAPGHVLWTMGNLLLALGLVALGASLLRRLDGHIGVTITRDELIVLTTAVLLSNTVNPALAIGQLPIFATALLFLSVYAQTAGRPVLAGVLLGVASAKVGTMAPFLLLFLRQADRATWIAMGSTVLALSAMQGQPWLLPSEIRAELHAIKALAREGQVNDVSPANSMFPGIVGFDALLYWVGVRDRVLIELGKNALVLALGAWVAFQVLKKDALPRSAACVLVCLYTLLFLYHRNYDLVLLAVPLVFAVAALRDPRWAGGRRFFSAMGIVSLLAMYQYGKSATVLVSRTEGGGAIAHALRAAVVPMSTWLLLLAIALFTFGVRASRRAHVPAPSGP